MKRLANWKLRIVVLVILLAGGCLYILINHSAVTQELTCKGHWKESGRDNSVAEVAHVRLTEYRWWVHLWADSDGNLEMQTEKLMLAHYIAHIRKNGAGSLAHYQFWREKNGDFQGGYRVANGEMTVKISDSLVFIGISCSART